MKVANIKCTPICSRIVSLYAEQNELQSAVPGGLIGVGTTMGPTLTRADRLVGQVLGEVGSLPDVYVELEVNKKYRCLEIDLDGLYKIMLLLNKKKYATVKMDFKDCTSYEVIEWKGIDMVRRDVIGACCQKNWEISASIKFYLAGYLWRYQFNNDI